MDQQTTEYQILDKAITAIQHEAGLCFTIINDEGLNLYDKHVDAIIQMTADAVNNRANKGENKGTKLFVEIKKWTNQANIGAIINQINSIAEADNQGLLVADYINPKMGERLKQAGIQFMDTVGGVIDDLMAQGFILDGLNKKQRKLADFDGLLDKWVEAY